MRDDGGARADAEKERAGFKDTREERSVEKGTKREEEGGKRGSESVHHHLHETVQPVIEKRELFFYFIPFY